MFALDARTGAVQSGAGTRRLNASTSARSAAGPSIAASPSITEKSSPDLLDGRVVALDQRDRQACVGGSKCCTMPTTLLTSAVRVVKGKLIVGSSGAEQAVRGEFSA